jgi:hypothetical protein
MDYNSFIKIDERPQVPPQFLATCDEYSGEKDIIQVTEETLKPFVTLHDYQIDIGTLVIIS